MTTTEKANEILTRIMSVAKELDNIYVEYEKYLGDIISESICDALNILDSFTVKEDLNWEALATDFESDSPAESELDKNLEALIENIRKVEKEYKAIYDSISDIINQKTEKQCSCKAKKPVSEKASEDLEKELVGFLLSIL
jgi:uncharacterized protein (UPF0335 family)